MDLGFYVLASLLGAGYMLNPNKQERDPRYVKPQTEALYPNGTNIYGNRDFYKVKGEEAKRVIENWDASKDPVTTNIIPMYYNTLHLKHQDVAKVQNPNFKKELILSVLDSFDEKTKKIIDAKKNISPKRVLHGMHDGERANIADLKWPDSVVDGLPSSSKMTPENGALDQIGGSLLPNRGYEDFTHNNMVPSYGGRLKQNMSIDNRMGADKLETFTGQFKLKQDQKHELGQFFPPTMGIANIYGNVEHRDMSRYVPSNLGKKNNELPFEKVIVGKGLNQGFTAQPSGGFHQFLRVMPKPTEETRVDPVFEQEGRINHGKAPTQQRALSQQLYKKKPELLVGNLNGERNFTTVGAVKGRELRPTLLVRDTNRKNSRLVTGPAKLANLSKPYIAPKTKVSQRINFFGTPFRNTVLASGKKINDHGRSGYHNKLNERAVTGTKAHTLNPKTWINAITAYFPDTAKKTRKQFYINNPRQSGYAKPQRPSALPAYDPSDVARTTIRETTENAQFGGNYGSSWKKNRAYDPTDVARTTIRETTENARAGGNYGSTWKKQRAYDPTDVARTTIRETTENARAGGNVKSAWKKHRAYDPTDVARTTIRETTENKKHKGWLRLAAPKGPSYNTGIEGMARPTVRETTENFDHLGNFKSALTKHKTYDPTDVARTTVRETTEAGGQLGQVSSIFKKHIAHDPNDVAKTTIKETTEANGHLGIAGGKGTIKKHRTYDPSDVARTTVKQTTIENARPNGNVGNTNIQSGKGYMTTNWYANNTNRQFTCDNEHIGPAITYARKTKSYTDAYNAEVNTEKEVIAEGRAPTKECIKVVNGPDMLNMQIKKIDVDRLNGRSVMKTSNTGNYFNPQGISFCTNTSEKNQLPQHDTRLDPVLLDAFKSNPLTQSLHSYY